MRAWTIIATSVLLLTIINVVSMIYIVIDSKKYNISMMNIALCVLLNLFIPFSGWAVYMLNKKKLNYK